MIGINKRGVWHKRGAWTVAHLTSKMPSRTNLMPPRTKATKGIYGCVRVKPRNRSNLEINPIPGGQAPQTPLQHILSLIYFFTSRFDRRIQPVNLGLTEISSVKPRFDRRRGLTLTYIIGQLQAKALRNSIKDFQTTSSS